jgi:hypothetical protein
MALIEVLLKRIVVIGLIRQTHGWPCGAYWRDALRDAIFVLLEVRITTRVAEAIEPVCAG